jgi:transcriptional regulator with XRE-family HTH domain
MLSRSSRPTRVFGEPHFSPLEAHLDAALQAGGPIKKETNGGDPTPLAVFVRRRLEELDLKQSDFCRLTGFDQGLLSKIQNSIITSLSLESTLRLALGLSVSPKLIFGLTGRSDLQELVMRAYSMEFFPELSRLNGAEMPAAVFEIASMAYCAHKMGRSLEPAQSILAFLTAIRRKSRDQQDTSAQIAEAYGI